jgi:uncharacterized protein YprB with RNaseH-like and TPR domain
MRTAIFDIETTDLAAVGAGILICACIQPEDAEIKSFRIDNYKFKTDSRFGFLEREETALLNDVVEELKKYPLLVGHNIDKFDIPFLRSRAYRLNYPCDLYPFTYDTLKAFRRIGLRTVMNGFGKPSAGLAHVVDFFGIPQEKTGIFPVEHWRTIWGNEKERVAAMNTLVDHCIRDVRMNSLVYTALLQQDMRVSIKRLL